MKPVFVGTAGWQVPAPLAGRFPSEGSHLERYAQRLPAVEINTSFYRHHRPQTYARWAASTPPGFRFAVKLPRTITHHRRLKTGFDVLERFLSEVEQLGEKLGPLLVQLPPSLAFHVAEVERFFSEFRARYSGLAVCEPRHPTWFTPEAERLLESFEIARVVADPAVVPEAAQPGGYSDLRYYRLHGSPEMYVSDYPSEALQSLAAILRQQAQAGAQVWCIFDNTAEGHAAGDALEVLDLLASGAK